MPKPDATLKISKQKRRIYIVKMDQDLRFSQKSGVKSNDSRHKHQRFLFTPSCRRRIHGSLLANILA